MKKAPRDTSLSAHLARVEAKVDQLAALVKANGLLHMTAAPPRLFLVGWREITAAVGKSARSLRRYRVKENFPVMRWGRSVISSHELIQTWLLARERCKRGEPVEDSLGERLLALRGWAGES